MVNIATEQWLNGSFLHEMGGGGGGGLDCAHYAMHASDSVKDMLKVPKRELFVTEFFTLRYPIWVGDLRTEPKNPFV